MLFWIIASILSAVVAALLLVPLLRAQPPGDTGAQDVEIYKDQLAEVDRDLARGILTEDDADLTRTEISRRLLAADAEARTSIRAAPSSASGIVAIATVGVVVGGGLGLYNYLGAPGYPDIPLAARIAASEDARQNRISQFEAEQIAAADPAPAPDFPEDYLASVAELRRIVPTRPDDLQGWQLLSQHEYALRNFGAAARAQARVMELKGDETTVDDRVVYVSQLIASAGGFISPEAEQVLEQILTEDARSIPARYYYGLLFYQTDRPDRAFRLWRDVVSEGSSSNPYTRLARQLVEDAAFRAGVDYTLPAENGPSLDDIAAATDLSEDDRENMIADMVNRLSDRLANEGGTVTEWARLITALGVLGDMEQAADVYAEALDVFGSSEQAVDELNFAAGTAGLLE